VPAISVQTLASEKLAHQPQRCPAVAAALDQHVEDFAFVVDGAPEIHPRAGDPNHHPSRCICRSGEDAAVVADGQSPVRT